MRQRTRCAQVGTVYYCSQTVAPGKHVVHALVLVSPIWAIPYKMIRTLKMAQPRQALTVLTSRTKNFSTHACKRLGVTKKRAVPLQYSSPSWIRKHIDSAQTMGVSFSTLKRSSSKRPLDCRETILGRGTLHSVPSGWARLSSCRARWHSIPHTPVLLRRLLVPHSYRVRLPLHKGFRVRPLTRFIILVLCYIFDFHSSSRFDMRVLPAFCSQAVTRPLMTSIVFNLVLWLPAFSVTVRADAVSAFNLTIYDDRCQGTYRCWRKMKEAQ